MDKSELSDRIRQDLKDAADWKERMVKGPRAKPRFEVKNLKQSGFYGIYDNVQGECLQIYFAIGDYQIAKMLTYIANQVAAIVAREMLAEYGQPLDELEEVTP